MIKAFLIGAAPLAIFMYAALFYPVILFGTIMVLGLSFAAYLIGDAIIEEFGDSKDD